MNKDYQKIIYRHEDGGVACIALDSRLNSNSQDARMLYELNEAMMDAARDGNIKAS